MKAAALALLLAGVGCAAPTGLLAGAAVADITPPVGWRQAGGYHEQISKGVLDPLHAKALVFGEGSERGAIVVLDLCSIGREVSDPLRRRIEARTGIPFGNIILCATHTHGGPEYYGVLWDVWRAKTIAAHGRDVHAGEDYVGKLMDSVVDAVARADAARRPVLLEHAVAVTSGIAFNRRHLMKDGTVKMNPGKRNPDVIRAMGPVDEALPFALFRDAAGGTRTASLGSFPMHVAVHGGDRFSADYPGHLQRALSGSWGFGFVSLLAEGAAGDVNHVDTSSAAPQPASTEPARIGGALAKAMLGAEAARDPEPGFAAARAIVEVPIRDVTREETERAWKVLSLDWVPNPSFLVMVAAYRILWTERLRARDGARAREELQAFRLGRDVALVALPHEIFVELGLEIRRRSPFRTTIVATLANDVDFYVPTRKAFAEGSYEIETSPYLPGGGELLVEGAVGLLEELKRR